MTIAVPPNVDKMDRLIHLSNQRLIPQALQRLTISETLSELRNCSVTKTVENNIRNASWEKDIRKLLSPEQDVNLSKLYKHMDLYQPSGQEMDISHKRNAVRYLALKTMLALCQENSGKSGHLTCVEKMLCWFAETATAESNEPLGGATQEPILPPRMSPKKSTMTSATMSEYPTQTMSKPLLNNECNDMINEAVSQKLKKYATPNLRASHIRRITELRARGEDFDMITTTYDKNEPTSIAANGEVNFKSNDLLHELKENFSGELLTSELFMDSIVYQVCRDRHTHEIDEKQKQRELQKRLESWSIDRTREESEKIRKYESEKLVAELDRVSRQELTAFGNHVSKYTSKNNLMGLSLNSEVEKSVSPGKALSSQHNREFTAVKKRVIYSEKVPIERIPTTKGLHFKNDLPPNFTPTATQRRAARIPMEQYHRNSLKMSNISSSNVCKPPIPSSNNSAELEKICTTELLSNNQVPGSGSSDVSLELICATSAGPDLQSKNIDKLDLHNTTSDSILGSSAMMPSSTASQIPKSFNVESRENVPDCNKLEHRNDINLNQCIMQRPYSAVEINWNGNSFSKTMHEAIDPEFYIHQVASLSRQPIYAATVASTFLTRQNSKIEGSNGGQFHHAGSKRNGKKQEPLYTNSEYRQTQIQEVDQISELLQHHSLPISRDVLEKGLYIPEDLPPSTSKYNLPLAEQKLLKNPYLKEYTALAGVKQKKRKVKSKRKLKSGKKRSASPRKK